RCRSMSANTTPFSAVVAADAKIRTPTGWVQAAQLNVGDRVSALRGEVGAVCRATPTGIRQLYAVTLRDGASVEATGDQRWAVKVHSGDRPTRNLSTIDIMGYREHGVSVRTLPAGPIATQGTDELPLDPYVVGALVADGYLPGRCAVLWTN